MKIATSPNTSIKKEGLTLKKASKAPKQKALSNQETASFCGQYAMLLKSGIAPLEAAGILMSDTTDPSGKELLSNLFHILRTGEKFHVALSMCNVFPPYVISMIKIGEESGNLDSVLESLEIFYEHEDNLADNFRNALMYPMIMIIMILMIVIVLITKVMPIFSQVFAQLGTAMSGLSQTLLSLGSALNRWSLVLIVILVLLGAFMIFTTQTRHGFSFLQKISKHIKPLNDLFLDNGVSRFASGMALAISSGMDTYTSLNLLKSIVENEEISKKIDICQKQIQQGDSFPEALKNANIFSNVYTRMVMVGFRTGSMEKVLHQISTRYEQKTNKKISLVLSTLEPTLVIVLSLIVGLILLSVILPLMGIMSSIG